MKEAAGDSSVDSSINKEHSLLASQDGQRMLLCCSGLCLSGPVKAVRRPVLFIRFRVTDNQESRAGRCYVSRSRVQTGAGCNAGARW